MSGFVPYQPLVPSRLRHLEVRGVPYRVREWGSEEAAPLVLVHGVQDASASFQFVVDALRGAWHVVAPDWRGHGGSGWTAGSYWHAEFMADLDVLVDTLLPGATIALVGHSMGANIASLYAGMRPERVERLVMLDALGDLMHNTPVKPKELLRVVLESRYAAANERSYERLSDLADRLVRGNRRLDRAKATFLAEAHSRPTANGRYGWSWDPSIKRSQPTLYTVEDWGTVWGGITAPVLSIVSSDARPNAPTRDPDESARRRSLFANIVHVTAPETGHNVHHDAPVVVAEAIEAFLLTG